MLWKSLKSNDLCCELFVNIIIMDVVDKIVWIEFETNLDFRLSCLRYIFIWMYNDFSIDKFSLIRLYSNDLVEMCSFGICLACKI